MANKTQYSALGSFTTAIDGSTTTPTLKNLANNGRKIGNALDFTGSGSRFTFVMFSLKVRSASAPAANAPVELYMIPTVDGTNYDYGDDSTDPSPTHRVHVFPLRAVSTGYIISTPFWLRLPSVIFKPFIYNKSGQAFTNTDAENILSYRTLDYELQ